MILRFVLVSVFISLVSRSVLLELVLFMIVDIDILFVCGGSSRLLLRLIFVFLRMVDI